MVSHGGGFVGFRAEMIRFPEQKFSVIVLAKLGVINPSRLARKVADIFLAEKLEIQEKQSTREPKIPSRKPSEKKAGKEIALTEKQLKAYVGDYFSPELDVSYCLRIKEGKLHLQLKNPHRPTPGGPLLLRSKDTFSLGRLVLNFVRDPGNEVTSFRMDAGRVKNIRFVK